MPTNRRLLACLALGCVVGSIRYATAADPVAQDDPAAVQKVLETKLPLVEKDKLTPATAVHFIAELAGANIHLNAAALRNAGYEMGDLPDSGPETRKVFIALKGVTLATAMDRLQKTIEKPQAPLRWSVENGVIVLSTAADKNWKSLRLAANENEKDDAYKDDRVLDECLFEDTKLSDVLKQLRDNGINVYFNWDAVKKVGIDPNNRIHLTLRGVRPRTVMQELVRELAGGDAAVTFAIRDSVWLISTLTDLERITHDWDWRPHHVGDQPTADKLAAGVEDVGFFNTPLGEVVDSLGRMGELTIDVDWPSLAQANIDRQTPITLNIRHVKLSTAIELVMSEAAGADRSVEYTAKDNTATLSLKPLPVAATKPTSGPATKPMTRLTKN